MQTSLCGILTLDPLCAIAVVVHEAIVFFINVVHESIFPKASKRSVRIPTTLWSFWDSALEFSGYLLSRQKRKLARRNRWSNPVKLVDNRDVGRAILSVEGGVVNIAAKLTRDFHVRRRAGGFWKGELSWMILVDMINSYFALLLPLHNMCP